MTRIAMDPAVMTVHADMHEEAMEVIGATLSGIPTAVDGGLASDTVVAIMQRVGEGADALYRIHGTLAEIVGAIADDAATNEQDVIDQLDPVVAVLEDF